MFVEVPGGRSQGVLPLLQFEDAPPKIGDTVEFEVERYDAANGLLLLTREGSTQVVHDWSAVTYGMFVEVKVTGTNKNKTGLTIEVNGIRGFLPASQLDIYRVENIEQFVNQRLKVMVAEVNPSERNLIVSRRAVIERERQVKAEEFWKTIAEGQVKTGIVRSVKPFGVFVDLGGGGRPHSRFRNLVAARRRPQCLVQGRRLGGSEGEPHRFRRPQDRPQFEGDGPQPVGRFRRRNEEPVRGSSAR